MDAALEVLPEVAVVPDEVEPDVPDEAATAAWGVVVG